MALASSVARFFDVIPAALASCSASRARPEE
jgi:hypothetical protein